MQAEIQKIDRSQHNNQWPEQKPKQPEKEPEPFSRDFYHLPCTALAPALLGQVICRAQPSGALLRGQVPGSFLPTLSVAR